MNADSLIKARAAKAGICSVLNTEKQFSAARIDIDSPIGLQILARFEEMPEICRKNYLKAMRGHSMAAGIKALCAFCLGWEEYRSGIRNCTDPACPLFPYRPYTKDQDTTTAETKPDNA